MKSGRAALRAAPFYNPTYLSQRTPIVTGTNAPATTAIRLQPRCIPIPTATTVGNSIAVSPYFMACFQGLTITHLLNKGVYSAGKWQCNYFLRRREKITESTMPHTINPPPIIVAHCSPSMGIVVKKIVKPGTNVSTTPLQRAVNTFSRFITFLLHFFFPANTREKTTDKQQ